MKNNIIKRKYYKKYHKRSEVTNINAKLTQYEINLLELLHH